MILNPRDKLDLEIEIKIILFSGGPRYCVGSKYAMLFLKTCLCNLLRNFEIDTPLKIDELTFRLSITMKFMQPYLISLKNRKF